MSNSCVMVLILTISLFLCFIKYFHKNISGRAILFNTVVSLVFVLRYLMTFLRNMGLAHKLPLDHSIYFHKVVGWLIFSQAWLHTIAHLINFGESTAITLHTGLLLVSLLSSFSMLHYDWSIYIPVLWYFLMLQLYHGCIINYVIISYLSSLIVLMFLLWSSVVLLSRFIMLCFIFTFAERTLQ